MDTPSEAHAATVAVASLGRNAKAGRLAAPCQGGGIPLEYFRVHHESSVIISYFLNASMYA